MSRYDRYDTAALDVLKQAQKIVRQQQRNVCEIDDLLAGLLLADTPATRSFLKLNDLNLNPQWLKKVQSSETADALPSGADECSDAKPATAKITLGEMVRATLDKAEGLAGSNKPIMSEHLLHAAWSEISGRILICVKKGDMAPEPESLILPPLQSAPSEPPKSSVRPTGCSPLKVLNEFGQDLTATDLAFPIIGRDEEIQDMIGILMKFFKPNPLLIGEAGVGKTAIVEGLASRIRQGNVPRQLQGCKVFEIKVNDLFAGTGMHGSFEERMRDLINELEANPNVILFLDEIHQLVQEGRSTNPADILKPALARGRFRCIGATTLAEYHRRFQKDEALARRFQALRVDEPDTEATRHILKGLKPVLEKHHGLTLSEDALEIAIRLGKEFIVNRRFPDKAIDVLDRAFTNAAASNCSQVTAEVIRQTVARIIGVSFVEDSDTYKNRLSFLEDKLGYMVLGQDKAVRDVANTVRLCKKRLDLRPERPDGVFLFTGPSGVGKTALAEALSETLTGSSDHCIRLDMSEFSEEHAVSRLIGSPAGYVGYGDPSPLIQGLRRSASGVLLLDEFEKAHPNVHRLFLQVFDSGRLTDAGGETYSLSNMTIIATANIFEKPAASFGFISAKSPPSTSSGQQVKLLRAFFPVELINRFDDIVVFNSLDRNMAEKILHQRVLPLASQNLKTRLGVDLKLSAVAEALVLDKGYSEELGVRNLQRAFEEVILKPLAQHLERCDSQACKTPDQCVIADLNSDSSLFFQETVSIKQEGGS